MRTCPHCKFLVSDGATSCSVCQAEMPTPVPVPAFVAPGQSVSAPDAASHGFSSPATPPPFGAPVPPSAGWPAGVAVPPPGVAPLGPVTTNKGTSTKKVLVIVGLLCMAPVLLVVGLVAVVSVLGTTSDELVADDVLWTSYDHPDGRYTVEMPGIVDAGSVDAPVESFGMPNQLDSAWVSDPNFVATVARTPDVVIGGQTFDTMPFATSGVERAIGELGLDGAELVDQSVVEGSGASEMDLELRGTIQGEESIFLSRIVIAGPDLYELNVIGRTSDEADLRAMHERLVGSFELAG